jgi:elongation factor 3
LRGQVDGFPPKEVVKTVFVEHDIQGDLGELNLVDYVQVNFDSLCICVQ